MIKKSIKVWIVEELNRRACPWSLQSLSMVLNGHRKASLAVAKELADIMRGTTYLTWMDTAKTVEQEWENLERMEAAVRKLAEKKKLPYFTGRGRPRKVKS